MTANSTDDGQGMIVNPKPAADNQDWDNPPLTQLSPPVHFTGTNGLSFKCEWSNPTDQTIAWGESAAQEMCFLWMYYYPSHGFDVRFM